MLIKYRFLLDGVEASPIWQDSLSKVYEHEPEQEFFRARLEGDLIFTREDFTYLKNAAFDSKFLVDVEQQKNGIWENCFSGYFTKTDCKWDDDNERVQTSLSSEDSYTEILAKMQNEYNLIALSPAKTRLQAYKRPFLQAYLTGENVIACFSGGSYWEQELEAPEDDESVLTGTYKFLRAATFYKATLDASSASLAASDEYVQERAFDGANYTEPLNAFSENNEFKFDDFEAPTRAYIDFDVTGAVTGAGTVEIDYDGLDTVNVVFTAAASLAQTRDAIVAAVNADASFPARAYASGAVKFILEAKTKGVIENGSIVTLDAGASGATFSSLSEPLAGAVANGFEYMLYPQEGAGLYKSLGFSTSQDEDTFTLYALPDGGESGTISVTTERLNFYTRVVTDADFYSVVVSQPLPSPDLVSNNRNYSKVAPFGVDAFTITNKSSETPTEYGLRPDDGYYSPPAEEEDKYFYPASRSSWGKSSIWFNVKDPVFFSGAWSEPFVLKDCYKIEDVLKTLLAEVDPALSHDPTAEFSEFLYGAENPLNGEEFTLMLTQKSNILKGDYDQPAQRAAVTLEDVFNMLRVCYKLFWFIEDNKLKIEHIKYFRNGRSYTETPSVQVDLTQELNPSAGKPWAYQTSNYEFDKLDIPERLEFEWMDKDVTQGFRGLPIETVSEYTNRGKVDKLNTGRFTSDIDYMLINPEDINSDGFALFAAQYDSENDIYELPFVELTLDNQPLNMQNGFASFAYILSQYYLWDLPSRNVILNAEEAVANGILRMKKQSVIYPSFNEPDLFNLIKTYIGQGELEKLSINLSSRMNTIELKYDTDE